MTRYRKPSPREHFQKTLDPVLLYVVQHASSLTSCIELCADTPYRVGTVLDSLMTNGHNNCYLEQKLGNTITNQSGFVFSIRPLQTSRSKASIAGPVIGAVVAAALVAAWSFWRKRRQRKTTSPNLPRMMVRKKGGQKQSWTQ